MQHIPLQRNVALLELLHVEAYRRYRASARWNQCCHQEISAFRIPVRSQIGRTYSIVNSPPCAPVVSRGHRSRSWGGGEDAHRQYPQQRRLARILQPNHGDIHLRGPAWRKASQRQPSPSFNHPRRLRRASCLGVGWGWGAVTTPRAARNASPAIAARQQDFSCRRCRVFRGEREKIKRKHQVSLFIVPEQAEQPIIDALQDAHHGGQRANDVGAVRYQRIQSVGRRGGFSPFFLLS